MSRIDRNSLLANDSNVLEQPGDYTHESFETSNITSVQGLVWMPHSCWVLGHLSLACIMVFIAFAQLFAGSVVMSYDTLTGWCIRCQVSFQMIVLKSN